MHTPGSAAHHAAPNHHASAVNHAAHQASVMHHAAHHQASVMHNAAHHRAHDMHRSAHRATVDHARRGADREWVTSGRSPHHRVSLGGEPSHTAVALGRPSGAGALVRFALMLVVVAAVLAVVLFVLRPTEPAWLEAIVRELDGLVTSVRGAVS